MKFTVGVRNNRDAPLAAKRMVEHKARTLMDERNWNWVKITQRHPETRIIIGDAVCYQYDLAGLRLVPANRITRWLLRKCKFDAIFMPWKTVYVLNDSKEMRAHELIHAEQVDRDGAIKFSIKWLWWTITKGYHENPLEIEAYANMHRHLK